MPDPVTGIMGGTAVLGALSSNKAASAQKSAANRQAAAQTYATDQQLAFQRENRDMMIPEYRNALAATNFENNRAESALNGVAGMVRDNQATQFQNAEGIANTQAFNAENVTRQQFSPYANAGRNALGDIMQGNFREDPSYRFRLQEGLDAVEASAAARGGLFSGATGQALQTRGQNEASQEWQNQFGRNMGIAGMGMQASGAIGNAAMGRAGMVGNAANNRAAGVAGAYADYGGALNNNIWRGAGNRSSAAFGAADGISGVGSNFANNSSNALAQYAQGIGAAAANRGDATAAGYAGMTNAISGGLNNYLAYDAYRNMRSS